MKNEASEQHFIKAIKRDLDESCENLDDVTLSRLRRARETALGGMRKDRPLLQIFRLPAAALATAALALIVGFLYFGSPGNIPPLKADPNDIELLASDESPDFYAELDFYSWLAEEHENTV